MNKIMYRLLTTYKIDIEMICAYIRMKSASHIGCELVVSSYIVQE